MTPVGGTFDLRVRRADYFSPVTVTQAVHEEDGSITAYPLPTINTKNWNGIGAFSRITVTDPQRRRRRNDHSRPSAPTTGRSQRVNPDGVDTPTYPEFCDGAPFTLGQRLGHRRRAGRSPVNRRGAVVLDGPTGD